VRSQGIRGFDVRLAFLDEAQFAPVSLLEQAIFPTLMMYEVVVVMITTPDDPDSLFMRLVTRTDETGRPMMPVIWLGNPCEQCVQDGRPLSCKHVWYQSPAWKDPERYARLSWLWDSNADANARENFGTSAVCVSYESARAHTYTRAHTGMATRRYRMGFTKEMIEQLRAAPVFLDSKIRPPVLFLTADSACGGESDYALCGFYCMDNMMVVRARARATQ
jgi:hypothetical protein